MFDNTNDYKSLICYLMMILIFFLFKKRNFIVFTFAWSFVSYSLGGGLVFGVPFARFYIPFLYLVSFYFLISTNNVNIVTNKFGLFNKLLVVLILKIILETVFYGYDEFRSESLIISFHVVILSMYIFHKSFELNGFEKTIKDFIISGLLVHGIVSVILFYPIFQNQLLPALGFRHRITIFNQDTINSAKPFYFFIVFLLASIQIKLITKRYLIIFASVIAVLCLFVVILNGSRQYLIGLFFVVIFPLIKLNAKTYIFTGLTIIMLPIMLSIIEDNFSDLAIVERFSNEELDREKEEGRSAIWKRGFNQMFNENPILGLGFRNFGIIDDVSDPESLIVVIRKDNAHGFFQEIFIEHGIILGLLLLTTFIFSVFELRSLIVKKDSILKSISIIIIAFVITSFFSGSFLNGIGYYLFGLIIYHAPKLALEK